MTEFPSLRQPRLASGPAVGAPRFVRGVAKAMLGLLAVASAGLGCSAAEAAFTVDTTAAHETLKALTNPGLTRAQALIVADLPANKALLEDIHGFGIKADRDTFADALVAAAHGSDAETIFSFAEARRDAPNALAELDVIEKHPADVAGWVNAHAAPFLPKDGGADIPGFVVAGGPGGGFGIDGPGFYVNVSYDHGEVGVTRVTMLHEYYHGVQHAAQVRQGTLKYFNFDQALYDSLASDNAKACYATRQLFGKLEEEGTASYVGNISLLPTTGKQALWVRDQREGALTGHISIPVTLFEMGIRALTGPEPLPESRIYSIGFTQAGQLYYDVGYVMAKAIAEHDGDAAIATYIARPGDAFVRRYIALASEPGSKLPKLGVETVRWAERANCPPETGQGAP